MLLEPQKVGTIKDMRIVLLKMVITNRLKFISDIFVKRMIELQYKLKLTFINLHNNCLRS